jgi:hypothetical protein
MAATLTALLTIDADVYTVGACAAHVGTSG